MKRKWSDKELETLELMSEAYTPEQIAFRLKMQGFHRTLNAIKYKLHSLGYSTKPTLDNYSCQHIARTLNVSGTTVCYWVRQKWLIGVKRSDKQYLIKARDLKKFLNNPPPQIKICISALDKDAISYLVG